MTMIVEDGSVIAGANVYATLAFLDSYHERMGNTAWEEGEGQEEAMYRAMAWLESRPWNGIKSAYTNPLAWPRLNCYTRDGYLVPSDEVPDQVVNAFCEASLIEHVAPGALRPSLDRGGQISSVSISGAVSVTYSGNAPAATVYSTIEGLVSQFVGSRGIIRVELA